VHGVGWSSEPWCRVVVRVAAQAAHGGGEPWHGVVAGAVTNEE
jgi:hypothetical protein